MSHTDSITDRLLATPRTDVIPDTPLAPKTIQSEALAEDMLCDAHARRVGAAAPRDISASALGTLMAQASIEASYRVRPLCVSTARGKLITLFVSMKAAGAEKNGRPLTMALVEKMAAQADPDNIDDFVLWFWRYGKYEIPKPQAAKEPQSEQPVSLPLSENAAQS
jgi:hypothetical protein